MIFLNPINNSLDFQIKEDTQVGRYLCASRAVFSGEIVLKEKPLLSGPPQVTGPVCLGCHNGLSPNSWLSCPNCGWPMCSIQCVSSENHQPECRWTMEQRNAKVFPVVYYVSKIGWLSPTSGISFSLDISTLWSFLEYDRVNVWNANSKTRKSDFFFYWIFLKTTPFPPFAYSLYPHECLSFSELEVSHGNLSIIYRSWIFMQISICADSMIMRLNNAGCISDKYRIPPFYITLLIQLCSSYEYDFVLIHQLGIQP